MQIKEEASSEDESAKALPPLTSTILQTMQPESLLTTLANSTPEPLLAGQEPPTETAFSRQIVEPQVLISTTLSNENTILTDTPTITFSARNFISLPGVHY